MAGLLRRVAGHCVLGFRLATRQVSGRLPGLIAHTSSGGHR